MKTHRLFWVFAILFPYPIIAAAASSLSAADMAEIKQLHKQYEQTWLKGDADGVRSLFADDCVLFSSPRRYTQSRDEGAQCILVPAGRATQPDNQIGRHSTGYRRRRADRLRLGHG